MCRYCMDTGVRIVEGTKCFCMSPGRRAFFAKKAGKKKVNDMLPSGHKHTNDKFLYETKLSIWFECQCGTAHKISA